MAKNNLTCEDTEKQTLHTLEYQCQKKDPEKVKF